jgi:hypothetical protein
MDLEGTANDTSGEVIDVHYSSVKKRNVELRESTTKLTPLESKLRTTTGFHEQLASGLDESC